MGEGEHVSERRPIVAANWKMHTTIGRAVDLAAEIKSGLADLTHEGLANQAGSMVSRLARPPSPAIALLTPAAGGLRCVA